MTPSSANLQGPDPCICLVAAVARNGVIGKDGGLPWRLPSDLRRFRQLTLGHPVIMGRKTWDAIQASLGRALPGRENIVISRRPQPVPRDARVVESLQEAVSAARAAQGGEQCFVIGGAEIYRLALPLAGWMYLTEIDANFEGDAYFPPFDRAGWQVCAREAGAAEEVPHYEFVTYRRGA